MFLFKRLISKVLSKRIRKLREDAKTNNNSSKKFDSNYHLANIVEIKKEKIDSSVKLNATQSPGLSRKLLNVSIASPCSKRKSSSEHPSSKLIRKEETVEKSSVNSKNKVDYENNLHVELLSLYKSKSSTIKEKIPSMIEQTFKLRRSIIESENTNFCDLIERFNYLLDIKNVIIKAILINIISLYSF